MHAPSGSWMDERQIIGMEHLPRSMVPGEFLQPLVLALTIRGVADQRKSQKLEVNPNLMCPACVKGRRRQGGSPQTLDYTVAGVRLASEFFIDRHTFAM